MSETSELLRASEAMRVLGVRSRTTLCRLRQLRPQIALRIQGMRQFRYKRDELALLLRDTDFPLDRTRSIPHTDAT